MSANTSDLGATQYEQKGELGKPTPAGDAVRQTIAGLLGDGVAVEELSLQGHNRPTKYTGIHTTQGIPLMLSGQADVVQVDLSEKVAAYPDPIKLVLQFLYTEGRKVVITKRTVTGGGIGVVPERTRGQVASMQVETRSEVLTRYGGDITMNLNAWLKPAEAAAELSGKLAAQRRELEKTLVRIGYETVMKSGTPMLDAIINSNSVYGMQNRRGDPAAKRFAEQVYAKSLFGALSRFKYPLPNLLAAARKGFGLPPGQRRGAFNSDSAARAAGHVRLRQAREDEVQAVGARLLAARDARPQRPERLHRPGHQHQDYGAHPAHQHVLWHRRPNVGRLAAFPQGWDHLRGEGTKRWYGCSRQ